jgi:hypothetical protein
VKTDLQVGLPDEQGAIREAIRMIWQAMAFGAAAGLGFLVLGRQEPVNVAAVRADVTMGGGIGPLHIEERSDCAMELSMSLPEFRMLADGASQGLSHHRSRFWFFVLEYAHRQLSTGIWTI